MPGHMLFAIALLAASCSTALGAGFERPIPVAQSAMVELWFSLASVCLCIALFVVHKVVKSR